MHKQPTAKRRHFTAIACTPALLAAVSCSNPSLLGISADVDEERATSAGLTNVSAAPAQALRSEIVISRAQNEYLQMHRPTLGDVDGDGLDDFLVEAPWRNEGGTSYGDHAYLYYGKPDFATQLDTGDADAVFDAGALPTVALGDINGDGLADFALRYHFGVEIVFGQAMRFAGAQSEYASGLKWSDEGDRPMYMRPLGDVDGDGRDELIVTDITKVPASEISTRGEELITDYIIAGRKRDWPNGVWDPSWAVASLGDEPPVFEDNGATTVLQRMAIVACADFDGDGYDDLLAQGRWRMWVFYGSPEGFHGTLTTEQADASLVWPFEQDPADDRRAKFAKTVPFVIGDADGDGTADIALPHGAELGIIYGTKKRWSGRVQLEPELTLALSNNSEADRDAWRALRQDAAIGLPLADRVVAELRVGLADLDGDGHAELVLHELRFPSPASAYESVQFTTYVLSGANKHATGRYVLSDADVYRPSGVSGTIALSEGTVLDSGGDFDGDGSTDLFFGVLKNPQTKNSETFLHLLPGAPHAPD